jgi:hypothetical protein
MADNSSSGMNAVVAIVAIIAILVIGYFAIQMFRGENAAPSGGTGIDVNLGTTGGGANP